MPALVPAASKVTAALGRRCSMARVPPLPRPSSRVLASILAFPFASLLACAGDGLNPPSLADERDLYWKLELNHQAVTLSTTAPYDTLTLMATPRNVHGEALTGLPAAKYTSADAERVGVTADGRLVAGVAGAPVWVVSNIIFGNLRHSDSVFVRVVENALPPVLTSFSIDPEAPDSAKSAVVVSAPHDTLRVHAADADGVGIPDLLTSFRTSNPDVAEIHPTRGIVTGKRVGTVDFYASATLFGVRKTDTLPYRIGMPVFNSVTVEPPKAGIRSDYAFLPYEVTIGTGGVVTWGQPALPNDTIADVDVIFGDTDLPNVLAANVFPNAILGLAVFCGLSFPGIIDYCHTPGNFIIPATGTPIFPSRARVFQAPGVYEYHSTLHGIGGRVVVVDER